MSDIRAVVFDVGRVLFQWDLRHLYAPLISDPDRLEWFVTCVVTEQWHHQHDEGRDLDEMVAERIAQFPDCADLIHTYATRFNDSVPGPVPGTAELVRRLAERGMWMEGRHFGTSSFPRASSSGHSPEYGLPVSARYSTQ